MCGRSWRYGRRFSQTRSRYISLVFALLRRDGHRVATGGAEGFVKRVEQLSLPGWMKSEVAPLLAMLVSVKRQIQWMDGLLERLSRRDKTVARLCTAPSVGKGHRCRVCCDRRRPAAFPERAPTGSLSWHHTQRAELGRDRPQRAHHQGWQLAHEDAVGAGCALGPAPAEPSHRGAAQMGYRYRDQARQENRHHRLGAAAGWGLVCNDARPDRLPVCGVTRTARPGCLSLLHELRNQGTLR